MDNAHTCSRCSVFKFALSFAKANKNAGDPIRLYAKDVHQLYLQWCAEVGVSPGSQAILGSTISPFASEHKKTTQGYRYTFDAADLLRRCLAAKFKHEHEHRLSFARAEKGIKRKPDVKRVIQLEVLDDLIHFGRFLDSKHQSMTDSVAAGAEIDDMQLIVVGYIKELLSEFVSQKR